MSDTLIWTGENVDEMEVFATAGSFGFAVGSNFHRFRWWHRAVNWTLAHLPLAGGRLPLVTWEWTPADDPTVLEVYPERDPNDPPWHWTTLRPGDAIDRTGRVERAS